MPCPKQANPVNGFVSSKEIHLNIKFLKYAGDFLAIDLGDAQPPLSWPEVHTEALTHAPFSFVLWICASPIWASDQTAFIAAIQALRQHAGAGGRTGPTAIACTDFMALDWVGPVRALAIPIYGTELTLAWTSPDGALHQCNPLHDPPPWVEGTRFQSCTGRRPKVDLL